MEREYITSEAEREYRKKYYQLNKEKAKAYAKKNYQRNRAKRLEQMKRYNMTHDRSEYYREYYAKKNNSKEKEKIV